MVQPGRSSEDSRVCPRVVPTRSLSAAILDGDLKIAHGTVSNMSETGAFLITNHTLAQGLAVRLVLSEGRSRILDTEARIVWSAEGFDPSSEIVGALQGVRFTDQSAPNREQLRRRLSLTEIVNPGFLKNYPPEEEELAYILIDPDIEYLISHEKIDYNDGITQIRQELESFLERYVAKLYEQKSGRDETSGATLEHLSDDKIDYNDAIAEISQELEPYLEQYVAKICDERSWGDETTRATLEYLEYRVPGYPFDRTLDCEFIVELMADFPGVDILEEVKTFRWHYEGQAVSQFTNRRSALRRWLAGGVNGHGNDHHNGNGNGNGGEAQRLP